MPARLGRYVVQRRIGAGGFATVWLAYDEQLDSPVAVKVLADNWTEDAHVRRRFVEEGRYLRRVESPHVVTVYDAGELDDGRPYLVMTYADQGTLADRLDDGPLTPVQSLEVVRQVAAGLQALHDRDVLHRDVKPANVLFRTVRGEMRVMLGDLGLGKALDGSSRLTMIAGTPSYVAPEQAAAEPIDARADQYSLAALSYLMLAGRPPFEFTDLKAAARPGEVPPLSTDERTYSAQVEGVVRRGLSPDREDRFATVTEYADALAEALRRDGADAADDGSGTGPWLAPSPDLTQVAANPTTVSLHASAPQPEPATRPRRSRTVAAIAAVAVLAALASGGAAYAIRRHDVDGRTMTLHDATGSLEARVPAVWRAVAAGGWRPTTTADHEAALSAGTSAAWNGEQSPGDGVFAGLYPGTSMPEHVPQHPECQAEVGQIANQTGPGGPYLRDAYTGCPGGGVVVEEVEQVATDQLLWIQVRDDTAADAYAVLNTVSAPGV